MPRDAAAELAWLAGLEQWPGGTLALEEIPLRFPGRVQQVRSALDKLVNVVALGRLRNFTREEVIESLGAALHSQIKPGQLGNLVKWLDLSAVQLHGKAAALWQDRPHMLVDTRVLQDMRPVFGDSEPPEPKATLVVHTLRLTYVEGGEVHSREYGMGLADIAKLAEQCNRALRQDAALADMAARAGSPVLHPEEGAR